MSNPIAAPAATPQRGALPTLGWACFLGASWTWVIGMFFPVLLLRDYGPWGWVVFAVPNVLGAAAMGFVLRDAEHSRRVMDEHLGACVRFSEVTIAFQVFAAGWVLLTAIPAGWAMLAALALLAPTCFALAVRQRSALALAAGVTAFSAVAIAAWLAVAEAPAAASPDAPALGVAELLLFAPASLAGFALCPYLDLTFHRARQATSPAAGRAAFAIGFGVVFLAMIAFSYAYAAALGDALEPDADSPRPASPALWIVAAHAVAQVAFTLGVHAREANEDPTSPRPSPRLLLPVALGALLAVVAIYAPAELAVGVSRSTGETLYRSFLLFYGLVFPAYAFLVMLPTRRRVSRQVAVGVFIFATLTALPIGFGGFVVGVAWWIPISLAVLVAARLALQVMKAPA